MRLYFDTGVFIDYLSTRGRANATLRSSQRRGRTPAQIAGDAERLFEKASSAHVIGRFSTLINLTKKPLRYSNWPSRRVITENVIYTVAQRWSASICMFSEAASFLIAISDTSTASLSCSSIKTSVRINRSAESDTGK